LTPRRGSGPGGGDPPRTTRASQPRAWFSGCVIFFYFFLSDRVGSRRRGRRSGRHATGGVTGIRAWALVKRVRRCAWNAARGRRGGRRDERTKHSRRRLVRAGARKRTTNAKRERVRVTRRGARSGLRGRHAQVHQAAVQGFALLNHVILLQELLQGEALLVEHELRGGGARLKWDAQIAVSFAPERGAGLLSRGGEGERERPRRGKRGVASRSRRGSAAWTSSRRPHRPSG